MSEQFELEKIVHYTWDELENMRDQQRVDFYEQLRQAQERYRQQLAAIQLDIEISHILIPKPPRRDDEAAHKECE